MRSARGADGTRFGAPNSKLDCQPRVSFAPPTEGFDARLQSCSSLPCGDPPVGAIAVIRQCAVISYTARPQPALGRGHIQRAALRWRLRTGWRRQPRCWGGRAQSVRVEYHWLEGKYDQLPALMANLVSRRVALIATPTYTRLQPATSTIPIVFSVAQNPV